MAKVPQSHLSRRERQIMEIIYRRGQASAAVVLEEMHDAPSYSAVRAMLRLLEEKGHLTHQQEGRRYIFYPSVAREKASRSAMRNLLHTFFDGSVEQAVSSLLDLNEQQLSEDDLERLSRLIENAKKEGR